MDQVTGLLYYGYRYYDPVTGRWPSRDPIGEVGHELTKKSAVIKQDRTSSKQDDDISNEWLNLYKFANNNPVSNIDINGENVAIGVGIGFCVADGPLPIGDIIGIPIIVGGVIYAICCQEKAPRKERCRLKRIIGRDGGLPFGNIMCVYDCPLGEGFITVGPGGKCPFNPFQENVEF
jgi:RHS repeat-associated protein